MKFKSSILLLSCTVSFYHSLTFCFPYNIVSVSLGNYHSSSSPVIKDEDRTRMKSEEETLEDIIRHEKSAASILCLLKTRHASQTPHLALSKDVLGVVAQLGKLDDDNLSRLV